MASGTSPGKSSSGGRMPRFSSECRYPFPFRVWTRTVAAPYGLGIVGIRWEIGAGAPEPGHKRVPPPCRLPAFFAGAFVPFPPARAPFSDTLSGALPPPQPGGRVPLCGSPPLPQIDFGSTRGGLSGSPGERGGPAAGAPPSGPPLPLAALRQPRFPVFCPGPARGRLFPSPGPFGPPRSKPPDPRPDSPPPLSGVPRPLAPPRPGGGV